MWDDLVMQATFERQERELKNRPQTAKTCNACKKKFPSGNQLFKHLDAHPLHQTSDHYVSYTVKCRNCDYHKSGHLNVLSSHNGKHIQGNFYRPCDGRYVYSVDITPHWRIENRYSIYDFDSNDIVDK